MTSHTSAASSRHLSASIIDSPLRLFLFYENRNGSLTILRNSNASLNWYLDGSLWVDVTNDIRSQLSDNSQPSDYSLKKLSLIFGAPFSSFANENHLAIYLATESDNALHMSVCDCSEKCIPQILSIQVLGDLRDSDIKIVSFDNFGLTAIWSSAQKLQMSNSLRSTPEPPFLFSRIAAISSNTSKEYPVMIYHQLTESVLVEEIWENTNRIWLKNNITI